MRQRRCQEPSGRDLNQTRRTGDGEGADPGPDQERLAVGGEGQGIDRIGVPHRVPYRLAGLRVPDPAGLVVAPGRDPASRRVEGDRPDPRARGRVAQRLSDGLAGRGVPAAGRAVAPARGERPPVGAETHAFDDGAVSRHDPLDGQRRAARRRGSARRPRRTPYLRAGRSPGSPPSRAAPRRSFPAGSRSGPGRAPGRPTSAATGASPRRCSNTTRGPAPAARPAADGPPRPSRQSPGRHRAHFQPFSQRGTGRAGSARRRVPAAGRRPGRRRVGVAPRRLLLQALQADRLQVARHLRRSAATAGPGPA